MSCLICHSLLCVCGLEDVEPESPFDIVREARQPKLSELSTAELPVQGEAVGYIASEYHDGKPVKRAVLSKAGMELPAYTQLFSTPTLKPSVNELVDREAFEKAAKELHHYLMPIDFMLREDGEYKHGGLRDWWHIWKSAIASHQSAKEQV
jgi:hypothetical protein